MELGKSSANSIISFLSLNCVTFNLIQFKTKLEWKLHSTITVFPKYESHLFFLSFFFFSFFSFTLDNDLWPLEGTVYTTK